MPKHDNAIVVDRREPGWFHLDNALIDRYGAQIGTTSIAVYALLARHANYQTGRAFPAYKTICKSLGISINTAIAALRRLEQAELITIEKQSGGDGHATDKNIYTLRPIARRTAESEEAPLQKLKRGGSKTEEAPLQKLTYPSSESAMEHDSINKTHVGDGDGRALAFLIDRGVGAAAEFAHLPYENMKLDYEARIAAGQTIAIIVKAWRSKPPTETYHYGQRTNSGHVPSDQRKPSERIGERPVLPPGLKFVSSASWKKPDPGE